MTLNIVNDYHLLAPNALGLVGEFLLQVNKIVESGEIVYSIGDNFDFANCEKKSLSFLEDIYRKFVSSKNVFHIDGNHCRKSIDNEFIIVDKIIMAHGDFEFWGEKKAIEYRSKPKGAGLFKRKLLVKAIELFEKNYESKINEEFLMRASQLAKNLNCVTYICGHKHNEVIYDQIYNGIRIMVLPRGFNKIHMEV